MRKLLAKLSTSIQGANVLNLFRDLFQARAGTIFQTEPNILVWITCEYECAHLLVHGQHVDEDTVLANGLSTGQTHQKFFISLPNIRSLFQRTL